MGGDSHDALRVHRTLRGRPRPTCPAPRRTPSTNCAGLFRTLGSARPAILENKVAVGNTVRGGGRHTGLCIGKIPVPRIARRKVPTVAAHASDLACPPRSRGSAVRRAFLQSLARPRTRARMDFERLWEGMACTRNELGAHVIQRRLGGAKVIIVAMCVKWSLLLCPSKERHVVFDPLSSSHHRRGHFDYRAHITKKEVWCSVMFASTALALGCWEPDGTMHFHPRCRNPDSVMKMFTRFLPRKGGCPYPGRPLSE